MQFVMMIYEEPAELAKRTDPAQADAYWGGWAAYVTALTEAGIMAGGNGLQPPAMGTSVRLKDGRRQVQDGPFADTKEQLGGYFVLEVPDLDTALEWAARSPSMAGGGVELRPVLPPMPG